MLRRWQLFWLSSRKCVCFSVSGPTEPASSRRLKPAITVIGVRSSCAHHREDLFALRRLDAQALAQRDHLAVGVVELAAAAQHFGLERVEVGHVAHAQRLRPGARWTRRRRIGSTTTARGSCPGSQQPAAERAVARRRSGSP